MHDIPGLTWFLLGAAFWPLWKLFHPYRCEVKYCGYITWRATHMFWHLEAKHTARKR